MNSTYADDEITVESLAEQLEETQGKLAAVMQYLSDALHAAPCEHCGHIHPRKEMLAVYGEYRGTDDKLHPESSRWFCGYCVTAACISLGGNQQEYRDRIGKWLALGYGRQFLREQDGYFAHLGAGANESPIAKGLRHDFAAEIQKAALRSR